MGKVYHASHSGYFPWCIKHEKPPETGIGTLWPISLPLKKFMSWFWKVKKWQLTGYSYGTENAPNYNYISYAISADLVQSNTWTLGLEEESQLVCPSFSGSEIVGPYVETRNIGGRPDYEGIGFISYQIITDTQTGNTISGITDPIVWSISFAPIAYLDDETIDQTIYPTMRVTGWFDSLEPGHPKVASQVDPYSYFYIDDIKIPCYVYWYPNYVEDPAWNWFGGQVFNLNPFEYWSYGETWNTETGEPL